MIRRYSEYTLGDMRLVYWLDEAERVSMTLIPLSMAEKTVEKAYTPEPLVQVHAEGDPLPNGYGNGITLACTRASDLMTFRSQTVEDGHIVTRMSGPDGRTVCHSVRWREGWQGVEVQTAFYNGSKEPVRLDLLSSVNLGGITPFEAGDTPDTLVLHRFQSAWSAEGRLLSQPVEEIMLERPWMGHALRIVKFGQVGSMPVRGFFPFAALEDRKAGVT